MFMIKRNQVVVTALAVMITAAGYLNFQERRASE
ncbi:MAG: SpoIIIAH-like family protein [Anaerotignum sp.]|nr:SpoIIIAH-like family protein [Anaerotignum sp.]